MHFFFEEKITKREHPRYTDLRKIYKNLIKEMDKMDAILNNIFAKSTNKNLYNISLRGERDNFNYNNLGYHG